MELKEPGVGAPVSDQFKKDLLDSVPHLRGFARILTKDAERADDLVQDTLVRALGCAHQFTPGTNFKAWMFTILRSINLNNLRRLKFQPISIDELGVERASVPASQERHLDFTDFLAAFRQLSPDQQEVLVLVGASGFSYEQTAEICGCAVGTVKSRLSRARHTLAAALLGHPPEPLPPPAGGHGPPVRRHRL